MISVSFKLLAGIPLNEESFDLTIECLSSAFIRRPYFTGTVPSNLITKITTLTQLFNYKINDSDNISE